MVIWTLNNALGGEIFVPKIPSYRIKEVAEAVGPSCKKIIIGIRPGEKTHEEMITSSDSYTTIDLRNYYAILPSDKTTKTQYIKEKIVFSTVEQGFSYNSGTNHRFLTVQEIRNLIKQNVEKNFIPT